MCGRALHVDVRSIYGLNHFLIKKLILIHFVNIMSFIYII